MKPAAESSSNSTSSITSSCSAVKYRGVRKRSWGKWVSEIRLPNSRERIWLGSYDSPRKAARAFDAALYCLRGRKAKFNFPASVPNIPRASALTPPEIQAAAAHFAYNIPSADVGTQPHPASVNSRLPERSSSEVSEDLVGSLEVSLGADGWWSELDQFFPAFDEFPTGLLPSESEPWGVDFGVKNVDDELSTSQHSFLWDF